MRRPSADLIEMFELYDEHLMDLALDAREALLIRANRSWELIYQTCAISTAFSFTEQLKHAFCHVAVYRKHVNLGFNRGTELPDPQGLLEGKGKLIRHVRLAPNVDLTKGPVADLIDAAVENMRERMEEEGAVATAGQAVVKSKKE